MAATPTRPPLAPPMSSLSHVSGSSPSASAGAGASLSPLTPTSDQVVVLYVMIAMAVVIFGVWNVPLVRNLINPLKLFTIGWHELCHISAAVLTNATILKITIDPTLGGCTIVEGGKPLFILSAGYIGSTLLGGLLVLGGWDLLVAKIMSWVIGVGMVMPLVLVRDKLTIILTVFYEALLIGFWFIDHGYAGLPSLFLTLQLSDYSKLTWMGGVITPDWQTSVEVVLSVHRDHEVRPIPITSGLFCSMLCYSTVLIFSDLVVYSILFVVWDVTDDRFFHKSNDSDATQFSLLYPSIGPHVWAIFWMLFQVGVLIAFIMIGLAGFKRTTEQMLAEAAHFLPT